MGALDTLNSSGAGITTTNGVLPDNSIPTSIARDTEINDASLTFTGSATGTFTANDSDNLTVNIPSANNGTLTVTAGSGLTRSSGSTFSANQSADTTTTPTHSHTSSQGSVNNSGSTFIQDITLDGFGHVTGITSATAGGTSVPGQTATGSYILMTGTRANTQYGAGQTVAPTGNGAERYGVTYGRSNASGSGDFQARTTTAQGNPISGGTWRSQSHGVTNQYAVNLMVRIS